MALRSGLILDSVWAINALNILLYDDTAPPFNLQSSPDLLNVVLEHFISVLSFLFPKHFKVCYFYTNFRKILNLGFK